MRRRELERIVKRESIDIPAIRHSEDCGTARYGDGPCYRYDLLVHDFVVAERPCKLVAARAALAGTQRRGGGVGLTPEEIGGSDD